MARDRFIRRVLWTSFVFNMIGALGFAFPASVGQLVGLPVSVPPIYGALLTFFVVLFGCAYAWLASQPIIDRPLVALSAFGKAGAFTIIFACWLLGAATGPGVVAGSGDLILAAIFAWWLLSTRGPEPAPVVSRRG